MIGFAYLGALLVSSLCMLAIDWRYRLFYWADARAAWIVTAVGVVGLLATDAAGIALGIFARGEGAAATGIVLAPELPLEEPIFLWFLVVCTMVLYTGARRLLATRRAR
jgi:lycopene cyclase domain-containing protein